MGVSLAGFRSLFIMAFRRRANINILGLLKTIIVVVGTYKTGSMTYNFTRYLLRLVKVYFLSGILGLSANVRKAGAWAVVTGCTDGIGKAYAEKLASKGLNVVLISRSLSKLEDMAASVEKNYGVSTQVIATDFSRTDIYEEIASALEGLDIGVLVNNVGCSYDHPEYFEQVETPDFARRMINMNCVSVAKMSQIVLPHMVQKRAGYVINVGSGASTRPVPYMAMYSGTKAFVEFFTKSLQLEYKSKGITVQCLYPYYVVSKLSKFRDTSFFVPSPATFVHSALNTLGVEASTTGYWTHEIQHEWVKRLPDWYAIKHFGGIRTRALTKKATKSE